MYRVDPGVPIPDHPRRAERSPRERDSEAMARETMEILQPGESFLVPHDDLSTRALGALMNRRGGRVYTYRTLREGNRVWRLL